jgi:hypothetical protein
MGSVSVYVGCSTRGPWLRRHICMGHGASLQLVRLVHSTRVRRRVSRVAFRLRFGRFLERYLSRDSYGRSGTVP